MVTITKTVEVTEEISKRELREQLIAQIIKHGPHHFNMSSWLSDEHRHFELEEACMFPGFNECGTTACLAGHAAHLAVNVHKMPTKLVETDENVAELFGFDNENWSPFSSESYNWPDVMRDAYNVVKELGDDEPTAEWRGALTYLFSLREQWD